MPKLRECPYCHTVYRYKDIILMKGKTQECYHCRKPFEVIRRYRIIPVLTAAVILVAFNLFLFTSSGNISKTVFGTVVIVNVSVLLLAFLLAPLMVRFRGLDRKELRKARKKTKS